MLQKRTGELEMGEGCLQTEHHVGNDLQGSPVVGMDMVIPARQDYPRSQVVAIVTAPLTISLEDVNRRGVELNVYLLPFFQIHLLQRGTKYETDKFWWYVYPYVSN